MPLCISCTNRVSKPPWMLFLWFPSMIHHHCEAVVGYVACGRQSAGPKAETRCAEKHINHLHFDWFSFKHEYVMTSYINLQHWNWKVFIIAIDDRLIQGARSYNTDRVCQYNPGSWYGLMIKMLPNIANFNLQKCREHAVCKLSGYSHHNYSTWLRDWWQNMPVGCLVIIWIWLYTMTGEFTKNIYDGLKK